MQAEAFLAAIIVEREREEQVVSLAYTNLGQEDNGLLKLQFVF